MHDDKAGLIGEVAAYYAEKLARYGDTPRGVDWNGEASQIVRFEQLCKVIDPALPHFSLADLGCGYGALLGHLQTVYPAFTYLGVDVAPEMVAAAERRHGAAAHARFIAASAPDRESDYGVASGIFNVRQGRADAEWFDYLVSTLDLLHRTSRLGFSFNCLTSYSDEDKKKDYLYYADPCRLFDLCKRRYSRQVALLHDYGLYEFTIVVRKSP
ncbi:class I SAM-dependent methyltransferase [Bordetella bronchialis]|uniref:class I SAM-dependent methyltransferase n=1 Tax=Bordetella bronchialis TaxID=463025 RepID=UPI003CFD9CD3